MRDAIYQLRWRILQTIFGNTRKVKFITISFNSFYCAYVFLYNNYELLYLFVYKNVKKIFKTRYNFHI